MKIRSLVTATSVAVLFVVGDLHLRAIMLMVRFRPSIRERALVGFMRRYARVTFWILRRIGGMKIHELPRVTDAPGTLILMNHQSLLDISILCALIEGGYPRIVTRERYARGIPLVSYMVKAYEHPLVDPRRRLTAQLKMLRQVAATSRHVVAIFPEGRRTVDGEIGPFQTAGLKAILTARPHQVYVVVADGMTQSARFSDFMRNASSVAVKVELMGPFAFSGARDEVDGFIDEMFQRMCGKLREMRNAEAPAAAG